MTPLEFALPDVMQPERLWLLVVPVVLLGLYVFLIKRKSHQGMRYTNTSILDLIVPAQSQWLRHVTVGLALLSLVALAFAWARPLGKDYEERERATVVIIFDVSYSMLATDLEPDRLTVAQEKAVEFIEALPDGYNVSVVTLSGSSSVVLPPSTDHAAAERAIQNLRTAPSTDVGGALRAAIAALGQVPASDDGQEPPPAVVVMFSDASGTTANTSPKQVAGELADLGVPLYAIVFGTDWGYVDLENADGVMERYDVAPDHQFFEDLVAITGGAVYGADNADQATEAFEAIGSQVGYVEVDKEVTAWWAGIAAVFAGIAAVGAVMLGARWR